MTSSQQLELKFICAGITNEILTDFETMETWSLFVHLKTLFEKTHPYLWQWLVQVSILG